MKDTVYVIGHKHPDTDSVVSAIAYAALNNALGENHYVAARAGHLNTETSFLLNRFGFQPPVYLRSVRTQVVDVDYAMLLTRDKSLSLLEIEMLSRVQLHRPLSNDEIAYLRKRKLVEGRKNALYFAKSVAKATGQEAKYTKNKGFDDNYYKDLIINYLAQHGKKGRAEINELLLDKLPDALTEQQKITKIGHLLMNLRNAGKIKLCEKKLWKLV